MGFNINLLVMVLFLIILLMRADYDGCISDEVNDNASCSRWEVCVDDTCCESSCGSSLHFDHLNASDKLHDEPRSWCPSVKGPSGLVDDIDSMHKGNVDEEEGNLDMLLPFYIIITAIVNLMAQSVSDCEAGDQTDEEMERVSVAMRTLTLALVLLYLWLEYGGPSHSVKKLLAMEENLNMHHVHVSPLGKHANDLDGRSVETLPEVMGFKLKNALTEKSFGSDTDGSFLDSFNKPLIHHLFQFRRDQSFHQTQTVCPAVSLMSHFSSGAFGQPGSTQELQKEGVRLTTFKNFPNSCPVSAIRMSQAGFYYTGEGDKVQCFTCGATYQGWRLGDRPHIIHSSISPHCPLVRGNDTSNMPLPFSTSSVPSFTQNGAPSIDSGYGSHDSTGQSQSDGVQSMNGHTARNGADFQTDGSEHEPPVLGTNLLSLSGPPALTGPAPDFNALQQSSTSFDPRGQASASAALATDCVAPRPLPSKRLDLGGAVYPLYSQMDARRRSFQNWQHVRGLPSVDELITLGFFYAGYADCVRCFFCGIGLKSWEPDDNPAEVHARWRPTCEYLRLVRGDEFVDRVAGGGNNAGENPNNQNREGGNAPDVPGRPFIRAPNVSPAPARNNSPQGGPPRPEPSNASNQQNSAPGPALPDTPAVRRARATGYRDQLIREAVDAIKNMGMEDQLDGMLLEVLANLNENQSGRNSSTHADGSASRQGGDLQTDGVVADSLGAAPPANATGDSGLRQRQLVLQQENARLRDLRTCQRCHQNSVGVIFLPCGHIVACADCAPNVRKCIRCDAVIRATANVYFS